MSIELIMKSLDQIEAKMAAQSELADNQKKETGAISTEVKNAIEDFGEKQRELADELLQLKQKGLGSFETKTEDSAGAQFTKSANYEAFASGQTSKARFEVKNTVTNTVGLTFSDRKPGVVGGAFQQFSIMDALTVVPTTSSSIDYVRENVFTNNAAEVAEAAQKPESSITFTQVNVPVTTIAHWIKISRQLAADNSALAAYIDTRMQYGVRLRLENQLVSGNGTAPNISGLTASGNFTAHGYTAANLTSAGMLNNKIDILGLTLGDTQAANYPADTIFMNPVDYWKMRLAKSTTNEYLMGDVNLPGVPNMFGLRVVISNSITAGNFLMGSMAQAATFYMREGIVVDMSDSDSDNFTKNLITLRAEMRGALAVEKPAALRYGLITPA
jgi:HK97 family phage major capsid protein